MDAIDSRSMSPCLADLKFACFADIRIAVVSGSEEVCECLKVHRRVLLSSMLVG
jgi:hypothetical protein